MASEDMISEEIWALGVEADWRQLQGFNECSTYLVPDFGPLVSTPIGINSKVVQVQYH